ncbi:unnamed protein product [Cylicostephanus goldi]|uniref:Uncharacterized protein n=1 Tax=Cylicostephanus goldi TaxID=71465 RepID=A0A3P6RRX7_CYLGO|nr:unnamed protein product [Cylicostephanus goldi]
MKAFEALQRARRDTDDMTVRQLFEDSDYVGDFEQIDATTAAAFVTEKLKPNSSHFEDLKSKKKLGNLKTAKRIPYFYGHRTKNSTASSTSPPPKYFVIKSKPNTEPKQKNPPIVPPQYGRQPHKGFMTRGIASVKAIRQPFVSDTWSNAGKQAYYRHHLSPTVYFLPVEHFLFLYYFFFSHLVGVASYEFVNYFCRLEIEVMESKNMFCVVCRIVL